MKPFYLLIVIVFFSTVSFSQIPSNDGIQNAVSITSLPFADINVQTQNATSESGGGMQSCDLGPDYSRVYYKYIPSQNEKIQLTLTNSNSNSLILTYYTPYTSFVDDTLLELAFSDICGFGGLKEIILFSGRTYYFLVSNPDGPTDFNIIQLATYPEILNIPDENFKNALINTNCIDTDLNGSLDSDLDSNNDNEIQFSEAVQINNLVVDLQNINDLTGIEYFLSLKVLRARFNDITTVDVSNLTKLKILNLDSNEIINLDLQYNFDLEEISLESNQFSSIDISNNIDLTYININDNSINSIDVSSHFRLRTLSCSQNNLTNLDVTQNGLLESLFCGENSISSLDISNNDLLRYFSIADNNFNDIDLTSHVQLVYLDVSFNNLSSLDITQHPALVFVYCSNNAITQLDISNQINLDNFNCSDNLLQELDVRNGFNAFIIDFQSQNNPFLECIYVDDPQAIYLEDWIIDNTSQFVNNATECETLSINEIFSQPRISIYPNPTNDYLFLKSNNPIKTVTFNDVNGRLFQKISLTRITNTLNIDTNHLFAGIYFIKIETNNGVVNKRMIKN
ncbi:MAG: T9SS type A sorting domain-containing protein [Aquaticitalea sp.]